MNKQLSSDTPMPEVAVSKIKKLYELIKDYDDTDTVTLQFVILLLFPTGWANIEKAMNDYYTQGYLAGLKKKAEEQANEN